MTPDQIRLAYATDVAIAIALVGLFVRGLHARCRLFGAYLAAVLVGDLLVLAWPATFYTMESWFIRQGIYQTLRTGTALELGWMVLRAFPGARDPWRVLIIPILGVTSFAALHAPEYVDWTVRVSTGTTWVLGVMFVLVMFGNIPLHRWHRDLLAGFGAYSIVFGVLLGRYGVDDWRFVWLQTLQPLAYLALTSWWAFASWRKLETYPGVSLGVLQRLRLEEA